MWMFAVEQNSIFLNFNLSVFEYFNELIKNLFQNKYSIYVKFLFLSHY